jgi:hypothetical protein
VTRLGIVAVITIGAMAAAQAAPQCYRASEIEADQALRYQAKLMVLSDSCRSDSYDEFVTHNAKALSLYQQQMIGFFRRHDAPRPEDALEKFLTRVANQIALSFGQEELASLCPRSADFLTQAVNFGKDEFRSYVAEQAAIERHSYRACTD